MSKVEKLKKQIVNEFTENNNIVFAEIGELCVVNLNDFINQNVDSMLYDLNRSEEVIMTLMWINPKWINDYAVCKVIRALKNKISELERKAVKDE